MEGLVDGDAMLTITDDDTSTALELSVSPSQVWESAGATTITATVALNGAARTTDTPVLVSVPYDDSGRGIIYIYPLTILAHETSVTRTFTYTPEDDSEPEPLEARVLRAFTFAADLAEGSATLAILDDDAASAITLSVSPEWVAETAGATTVTVTAALDAGTRGTATDVTVSRTGGTATSATDYAAVDAFTVTIPAGQASATGTFTFTPTDDSLREGPETVRVGGGVVGDADLSDWDDEATLTITDDDAAALVMLSVSPEGVWEHLGPKTVTVTAALQEARSAETKVRVTRTGGTAITGRDYTAALDFTVTIPAEQTSATATFTLTPVDDSDLERNKTVILGERVRGRTLNTAPAELGILDDESLPMAVRLGVSPGRVEEHAGATTVTVTASLLREHPGGGIDIYSTTRPTATEVTVSRTGGTATSGTDYEAVEDFTLTIPARESSGTATFTFTPTEDDLQEVSETVILSASGEKLVFRSDYAQRVRTATFTILDDDTYVPANWSLIPPGLASGDRFRLLFVAAAGLAPSPSDPPHPSCPNCLRTINYPGISLHNEFVQSEASADSAHVGIRAYSSHFRVLGSGRTPPVGQTDARDNTWTTYTDDHKGVPIYWLGGSQVADDYEDLYDGDWDDEANPTDSSGQVIPAGQVWTGSDSDGTGRFDRGPPSNYRRFGDDYVGYGVLNDDNAGGPLSAGIDFHANTDKGYYALSRVLRVDTAAVDPTAIVLSASPVVVAEDAGATTVTVTATLDTATTLTTATEVTVSQTGGTAVSGTDYEAVENFTVTDVDEPPETPDAPTVVGTAADSVQVSLTAPKNTGPAISDYDVRYQADGSESWTEVDHVGTGLSTTVAGLVAGTYAAQVRATNPEGTSGWSSSGTGTTKVSAREVASGWSLAPSGLAAGEAFRLLFVSSGTRYATSTDIGDYNTFVQTAAAAGHTDIQAYSAGFRAVASTADVDARGNTGTVYTEDDKGLPIYWLGGAKLADHYEDLYDGSWDEEGTGRDEAGDSVTFPRYDNDNKVWTGSGHDGTESIGSDDSSKALGTAHPKVGVPNFPFIDSYGPLTGQNSGKWSLHPLYGLSEVFQIGAVAVENSPPAFADETLSRSVAENSAADTAVGAVIPAATDTDTDNDTPTYSLEGTDAESFAFDAATRQIKTKAGVTLDHETDASYSVTVKADDGNGGSDTVAVTITVTDVAEQPETPSVTATEGTTTGLDVTWTAPGLNGGPALTGYKLRHRKGMGGSWTEGSGTETGTSATIGSLDVHSGYQVRVRGLNGETPSAWSPSGSGSTRANSAPEFANDAETRSVPENSAAETDVGAAVTATDTDTGDTVTHTLEGTDAGSFDIVSTSGQIRTKTGVTLDHETDASYSVTVKADDGNGGSDTVAVTITVTDVAEQPATPSVTATSGSTTGLDVTWTAPGLNGGPALTGYEVEYRKVPATVWTDRSHSGTGTGATIAGLDASSEYQVRVRALNGETPSDWSPHGSGTTGTPNSAPEFANAAEARSVAENTAAAENVGAVVTATEGTTTGLDVSWTAPGLNGGPALTGYDGAGWGVRR